MLETTVTIILAPIALFAAVMTVCIAIGVVRGIKQGYKKRKDQQ